MDPRQSLLAAWADLAPSARTAVSLEVARAADLWWLGTSWSLFASGHQELYVPRAPTGTRLAKLDALNEDVQALREGWVFLAGSIERDGATVPVLLPLLERPVHLATETARRAAARSMMEGERVAPQLRLRADGEAQLIALVEDQDQRAALEAAAEFGRGAFRGAWATPAMVRRMPALTRWVQEVARATGLTSGSPLPISTDDPTTLVGAVGLRIVVGGAVYLVPEPNRPLVGASLEAWSRSRGLERTSFGALYGPMGADDDDAGWADPPSDARVLSPLPLSPSQERLVLAARDRPLTVVSGAPGTGKSHAVAAVALDHVAAGRSVLIATRSRFAARAIADLIHRVPGPNALRFGDIVDGSSVVDELNDHLVDAPAGDGEAQLERAVAAHRSLRSAMRSVLGVELAAEEAGGPAAAMRVVAPNAFEPGADLAEMDRLAEAASASAAGWFGRRRHRRARAALASAIGAPVDDPGAVAAAVEHARRRRLALTLEAEGGTVLGAEWDRLVDLVDDVHRAVGAAARERQDRSRRARGSVAELLAALRAGRGRRRELLAGIDAEALTAAVPLWIGTLGDIEDLLPARAASFDLVILDEAAHIDQPSAAPALLRGARAVVVGDPRQLRHVSFLADEAIAQAMADHGISDLAAGIDLRRNSVFDRAAAVAPVLELVEHYRSVPHLVEFPIAEFYRSRIQVMTRRPDTEREDVIEVVAPPEPGRSAEVAAAVDLLGSLSMPAGSTIGLVTPFREHADALQQAVLAAFDEADIRRMGLRVGTVHGFQGAERDAMVLALGLSPDDPGGRRAFVENRNLFNVMVTRARTRQVVLTTVDGGGDGLLSRYLAHASRAPSPAPDAGTRDPWALELRAELARAGVATRAGYVVGPWTLELVLDDDHEAIALETCVHGGDPDLHLDRRLALAGLGWRFVEAYPTRWWRNSARAALELPALIEAARRRHLPPPPSPSTSDR
ncbi:MAG: ATP-binding protein [Actinobacteria bacterium]|nr:ATP-binding protein [Actinomycetota bacterium]